MKETFHILLCLILLFAKPVTAAEQPPCAVYIILDPSWSCEHSMPDFRSLARQAVVSLRPGDYIEILSAGTVQPKIRLAQYLKHASTSEFREIQSALEDIHSQFLYDASISKAVAFCINRIRYSDNRRFNPKIIFVFTDGKLKSTDIRQMKTLYSILERKEIDLYVTGKDQTTRGLLIAANQKRLHFSLLQEANPALFLLANRSVMIKKKPVVLPVIETPKDAAVPNKIPEPQTGVEIEQQSKVKVTVTRDASTQTSTIEQENVTEPDSEVIKPTPAPSEPVNDPGTSQLVDEKPVRSVWAKIKKSLLSPWFWIIPGAGVILLVIGLILLLNFKKANQWASKIQSALKKSAKKTPDRVIIRFGDRIQHLGRFSQINIVHIGSGPKNSIRIHDKSIPEQQLRLFRKGRDLYLKNLSQKPVWINGITLASKKTQRLPLPSILKLSDSVTIRVELQKTPAISSPTKEASNGQSK